MEQCTLPGSYETLLALFTLNLQAYESTANGIDADRELRNFEVGLKLQVLNQNWK